MSPKNIAIIGGGPAGLMAAEIVAGAGHMVTVYERKPTLGRKFLMAGRGGLNLTHSEDYRQFIKRYGTAEPWLDPVIAAFPPDALRQWCEDLGEKTFVGSSGRVFPVTMKASPLLRAWTARLASMNVKFVMNCDWTGWDDAGQLTFKSHDPVQSDATLLALGGASWPRLGSDGGWIQILQDRKVDITPMRPSNCGFFANWSDIFKTRFAGTPLKSVTATFDSKAIPGELIITNSGVEGGLIYAFSATLRDAIERDGHAMLTIDLRPGLTLESLTAKLRAPRARQSLSTWLQKSAGLTPLAINLIRESVGGKDMPDESPDYLARMIKSLPIRLTAPFSIDRAISSAGGITQAAVDDRFMLHRLPGIFVAGEMLDWEAPTGGYLLQASFSTAFCAGHGILDWLKR